MAQHQQSILTCVSMLIFGAVSLANLMNCLGSKVLTTISPDFCTALKAAAVDESYRFCTVSIWRKTSSEIPVACKKQKKLIQYNDNVVITVQWIESPKKVPTSETNFFRLSRQLKSKNSRCPKPQKVQSAYGNGNGNGNAVIYFRHCVKTNLGKAHF
jgi:hypothetical protein